MKNMKKLLLVAGVVFVATDDSIAVDPKAVYAGTIYVKETDLAKHSHFVSNLNDQVLQEQVKLQQCYNEQQSEAQKAQPSLALRGSQIAVEQLRLKLQTNIKQAELEFQAFEELKKKELEQFLDKACELVLNNKGAGAIQRVGAEAKVIIAASANVTKEVAEELDKLTSEKGSEETKALKTGKGLFANAQKTDATALLADASVDKTSDVVTKDLENKDNGKTVYADVKTA